MNSKKTEVRKCLVTEVHQKEVVRPSTSSTTPSQVAVPSLVSDSPVVAFLQEGGPTLSFVDPNELNENSLVDYALSDHSLVEQALNEEALTEQVLTEQALAEQALSEKVLNDQTLDNQSLMVTTAEEEALSSLLNSVPLSTEGPASEQRVAFFQADDGQILCLTYSMAEDESNEAEVDTGIDNSEGNDKLVDEISSLQPDPIPEIPVANTCTSEGDVLLPEFICLEGSSTVLATNESLSALRLEDRLRVVEHLLPPAPPPTQRARRISIRKTPARRPAPAASGVRTHPPRIVPAPERPADPGGGTRNGGVPISSGGGRKNGSEGSSQGGDEEGPGTKRNTSLYVCDLCGANFERPAQFYGHLHRHRGERKYKCTFCSSFGAEVKEFSSSSALRVHQKTCHPLLRPHTCTLCGEQFDRASQRDYHTRRVHAGERPHRCALCPKAFFKRSDLRTHLNVHLRIHACVCETCGRRFGHVSNLIRHMRTHAGSRPYPCPV